MSHLMRAAVYANEKLVEFHSFRLPELGEKYCHRHNMSYAAFKTAQCKILRDSLQDGIPYAVKRVSTSFEEEAMWPLTHWPDIPKFQHADIYAFYTAIGWSYTRKKFWKELPAEVPCAPIH